MPTVNLQLKKTEGVVAYEVSFEKGEALVSYDAAKTTPAKIAESVTRIGYTAFVKGTGGAAGASAGNSGSAATTGTTDSGGGALERMTGWPTS